MPTATDIRNWIQEGTAHGARAMLVVWDEYNTPPECYPVFIAPSESVAERFAALDGMNMQRVHAVYLLSQN